jgi:hypothetical protein
MSNGVESASDSEVKLFKIVDPILEFLTQMHKVQSKSNSDVYHLKS